VWERFCLRVLHDVHSGYLTLSVLSVLRLLGLFGEGIEISALFLLRCRRRPWLRMRSAFLGRRFRLLRSLLWRVLAIGDSKDKRKVT
jgi:hypothetical protein